MNMKKKEDTIKSVLLKETDCPYVSDAFEKMLKFFEISDKLDNTNHTDIIKSIYFTQSNAEKNLIGYTFLNNVSERTLFRYRNKYLKCFLIYYEEALKNDAETDKFSLLSA